MLPILLKMSPALGVPDWSNWKLAFGAVQPINGLLPPSKGKADPL